MIFKVPSSANHSVTLRFYENIDQYSFILRVLTQQVEDVTLTGCMKSQNTEIKRLRCWLCLCLLNISQPIYKVTSPTISIPQQLRLQKYCPSSPLLAVPRPSQRQECKVFRAERRNSLILWVISYSIYIKRTESRGLFICLVSSSINTKPKQSKILWKMNHKMKGCCQ